MNRELQCCNSSHRPDQFERAIDFKIVVGTASSTYMVNVVGYDMMSWTQTTNSTPAFAPGNKVLYAYRPNGSLKFPVQLAQATVTP